MKKNTIIHSYLINIKEILAIFGINTNDIIKMLIPISSFIGALLLLYYAISTKTPLPPADTGFGIAVLVFIIVFFFLLFIVTFVYTFPATQRESYLYIIDNVIRCDKLIYKNKVYIFIIYFISSIPFILLTIIHYYNYLDGTLNKYLFSLDATIDVMILYIISIFIFYILYRKNVHTYGIKNVSLHIIKYNSISIFWGYLFFLVFIFYNEDFMEIDNEYFAGDVSLTFGKIKGTSSFIAVFIMISAHFFLVNITKLKNIIVANILLYLMTILVIFPGANNITAFTLRLIGAGGGVHANIQIKTIDESGKNKIKIIKSCIMISTSTSIIIKEVASLSNNMAAYNQICKRLSTNNFRYKLYEKYEVITSIYNRQDIHSISIETEK